MIVTAITQRLMFLLRVKLIFDNSTARSAGSEEFLFFGHCIDNGYTQLYVISWPEIKVGCEQVKMMAFFSKLVALDFETGLYERNSQSSQLPGRKLEGIRKRVRFPEKNPKEF